VEDVVSEGCWLGNGRVGGAPAPGPWCVARFSRRVALTGYLCRAHQCSTPDPRRSIGMVPCEDDTSPGSTRMEAETRRGQLAAHAEAESTPSTLALAQ
jgi:hypothetical protein